MNWRGICMGSKTVKVYKVGGSCLASKEDLNIVLELAKDRPVFVFSALKGVTDKLILLGKAAETGACYTKELRDLHYDTINSKLGPSKGATRMKIDGLFSELEVALEKVRHSGKLSLEYRDSVQAFGERLIVPIMEGFLNDHGIKAKALSDKEAGFTTNSNFGDAEVPEEQYALIRERVNTVISQGLVPVVAGFVGRSRSGKITTLGRGGSDLTATLIATALGCDVVLFKDVDGLMSADPSIVLDAKIIKNLNIDDALEIAHYGSKIIYEKAIFPLRKHEKNLYIRSFRGKDAGTEIGSEPSSDLVVSTVKEVTMLKFTGDLAQFSQLVSRLAELKYYPLAMLEISYGEVSMALDAPKSEFLLAHLSDFKFTVESGYALVALVGTAMKGKSGVAARIFDLLADKGINVVAIFASPSERNISVIIDKQNLVPAANAIHGEFVLKLKKAN